MQLTMQRPDGSVGFAAINDEARLTFRASLRTWIKLPGVAVLTSQFVIAPLAKLTKTGNSSAARETGRPLGLTEVNSTERPLQQTHAGHVDRQQSSPRDA
jgi:hypothetical protein